MRGESLREGEKGGESGKGRGVKVEESGEERREEGARGKRERRSGEKGGKGIFPVYPILLHIPLYSANASKHFHIPPYTS